MPETYGLMQFFHLRFRMLDILYLFFVYFFTLRILHFLLISFASNFCVPALLNNPKLNFEALSIYIMSLTTILRGDITYTSLISYATTFILPKEPPHGKEKQNLSEFCFKSN